jgi:aerobic-type carbon monoxide dehydrogenase small subunit (CoxS/CutS family)
MKVVLTVNGEYYEVDASPGTSLADVLRETLGFTGVKRGCDSGGCGMCTVLLDGRVAYSCMTPCWRAEGAKVTTVEGLESKDGKLHALQESFIRNFAPQCGYCTPAMLLAAKSLMDSGKLFCTEEEEIKDALCGVLCRCTGYTGYLRAIREALAQAQEEMEAEPQEKNGIGWK